MPESTERGIQGHRMAFDIETALRDPIMAGYPEAIRLKLAEAIAIRMACEDFARTNGHEIREVDRGS